MMNGDQKQYRLLKRFSFHAMQTKLFTSQDESNDFFMWAEHDFRPMKQDFSANFMNRWLALTAQNSYEAKKRLNRFMWQQFISELIKSGSARQNTPDMSDSEFDDDSNTERDNE